MIKMLQRKFIVTAMIAVTVLLAVLLGLLNGFNAWSAVRQSERLVQVLVRSEAGPQPDAKPPFGPADGKPTLDRPPEDGELRELMGRRDLLSQPLTDNDTRAAVYFTVRFAADGTASADVSRIAGVSEDEAIALAEPVFASGASAGRSGGYRYAAETSPDGGTVCVFLNTESQAASVLRVGLLSVLLGAAAWALMLLLVSLLSRKAIRPIAENMEKQRRFVTDAGHEIKTPLAIIQANAEALELCAGESKYTKNIRAQVTRLGGLMQELLTLARADEGRAALSAAPLDFSALVVDVLQGFQAPLELRGLRLESDVAPSLTLQGDRTLLTRLVSILADNAVKYAAGKSLIRVSLQRSDKTAVLTLTNRCDALPDCPPEKLFDRFYRADAARTQASGGYGIGLSAAQAIASAHRGSLTAAYSGENTITFTAKLPLK